VTFGVCVSTEDACNANAYKQRNVCSLSPRGKHWPFPWWDPEWRDRHTKACRWWNETESFELPEAWQAFAKAEQDKVKWVELQLPQSHGAYPADWGNDPFPPARGQFSSQYQEWLRQDVPAIWPDVDSSEDTGGIRTRSVSDCAAISMCRTD
jgi:hypothetical protein